MANWLDANLGRSRNINQNVANIANIRGQGQDRRRAGIGRLGDVFGRIRGEQLSQEEAEKERLLKLQLAEDEMRNDARTRGAEIDFRRDQNALDRENALEVAKNNARYAMERAMIGQDEDRPDLNEIYKAAVDSVYQGMDQGWLSEDGTIDWTANAKNAAQIFDAYIDQAVRSNKLTTADADVLKQDFLEYIDRAPQVTQENPEEDTGRRGRDPWIDERGLPSRGFAGNLLDRVTPREDFSGVIPNNNLLNTFMPPGEPPVTPLPDDNPTGDTPYMIDSPPISVAGEEVGLWDKLQQIVRSGENVQEAQRYMDDLYERGEASEDVLSKIRQFIDQNLEEQPGMFQRIGNSIRGWLGGD